MEPQVDRLLAGVEELRIDRRVADWAGLLRRQAPALRLADALIAPTVLVHSLALHTKRRRDLQKELELRLRCAGSAGHRLDEGRLAQAQFLP
ncbi:MAG: hypothetical protein M0Z42_17145 [Actinomycetota bacterium]|nr:hypothetical protein [Actinomycetota bacterium]